MPLEMYHCSYLVDWVNTSAKRFRGVMEQSDLAFEGIWNAWKNSMSCQLLKSQLEELALAKSATKIVCFGLGDFCRPPPEWWMRGTMKEPNMDKKTAEASAVYHSMVQHSMALTMAEVCGNHIQLLAQDPGYTEEAKRILKRKGFSVIGQFGAEGFAEIDDNSVVFSAFVAAPLKQIIADVARPLLIIETGFSALNDSE